MIMNLEYSSLAKYYDLLHNQKDYSWEANDFLKLINKYKKTEWNYLLDIACGTWNHISYFKEYFQCDGLDISKDLIDLAKQKNNDSKFFVWNMIDFVLPNKYDAITSLFSSTSYLSKEFEIEKTLANFYNHLNIWWVLLIENVYIKDFFEPVKNHIRSYDDLNISINRIIDMNIDWDYVIADANYNILDKKSWENYNFRDKHMLRLFGKEEIEKYLKKVWFNVSYSQYITGTHLFVWVKR